jgi:hypothetical protein
VTPRAPRSKTLLLTAGLLLLAAGLLLPAAGWAQEPQPAPSPEPWGTLEVEQITWAHFTRGEKREYIGGRAVLDVTLPERFHLIGRADVAGSQDGGALLDLADPQSYRSVEAYLGVKREVAGPFALAGVVGTAYDIDKGYDPSDLERHTLLLLARVPLPAGGYAYVGGGHRGPVGGAAAVASISYRAGPTRLLVDYDLPFSRAAEGEVLPWVLRIGVAIPLRKWELR